jgi:hypothetical protein
MVRNEYTRTTTATFFAFVYSFGFTGRRRPGP